jgi:hypothetical protein
VCSFPLRWPDLKIAPWAARYPLDERVSGSIHDQVATGTVRMFD